MKKQRLRIRWLEESLLAIFLIFFSNGQVGEAKTLAKRGSLPLYREDLMPLTVERPSFYDDPPLWTIRLRNQPQGLLEPEAGFYRPVYGILRRKKPSFARSGPSFRLKVPTFLRLWDLRKSSPFWCVSLVLTAVRPSVKLPLFLQDRGLSGLLSLNLESQGEGIGGKFPQERPRLCYNKR